MRIKHISVYLSIFLIVFTVQIHAQSVTAIKGGTVMTMTGKIIDNGTIVMKDGKITEVGRYVSIPMNAKVYNASGKYVMPGLVDAMTYYGIKPFDLNDVTKPVTPENKIIQAYYPYGEVARGKAGIVKNRELLSGGVTTVYIAPGDRQVIGGQGAVVKVFGDSFESMILREPAAIDMTIGETAKRENASPATRMAIASILRKTLLDAKDYEKKLKEYEEKTGKEKEKAQKPKRDLGNEALLKLLRKKIPARIETDLVNDIRTAMRIAGEFDFDLIIDSGIGAYKLRDMLAEKNIPVILGPVSHPYITGGEVSMTTELAQIMTERNAALLNEAEVKIAIASFGFDFGALGNPTQGRWLLLEAGLATGFGLPDDVALKSVTINPAEILGVSDRIGSLEPGKDADVIILDGPPLSIKTWVEKVFINGQLIYEKE